MTKKTHLPLALARRMALNAQLLTNYSTEQSAPHGKEGVAQTIEKLGYVQIDTIAVVQRAHHHTLWARRPDYDPAMLHELQACDRRIFEYWGHAASYLPMADYRFYRPRMRSFDQPNNGWYRNRLERCGHLMPSILERIRQEGPLASKDFAPPPDTKRGTWWDWKPAKVALELLFWRGDLMVSQRRNFQRVYDLAERVLPGSLDTRMPDQDELGRFLVQRALSAYGVAREREIADHIHSADKVVVGRALAEAVSAGQVVEVKIEGIEGATYYTFPHAIEAAAQLPPRPAQVTLLSPFDNLIIQRDRMRRLFGFDYTIECYTPAAKRQYGYFTLPVLWGERLVGRLDPKAERKTGVLTVRSLTIEAGFEPGDDFWQALKAHLDDFARFNGCQRVDFSSASGKTAKARPEAF